MRRNGGFMQVDARFFIALLFAVNGLAINPGKFRLNAYIFVSVTTYSSANEIYFNLVLFNEF